MTVCGGQRANMAADHRQALSASSLLGSICVIILTLIIFHPDSTEAAYRGGSYRGGYSSYRSYSYRSYSYSSYRSYSYRSYSYRSYSYSSYRSVARYSYTPYSYLRYSPAYYSYPYYYYSLYFYYRPYGAGVYMSRDSYSSATVCENWESNDNGTSLGYFVCPLMTSEPSDYTACCGESWAQYCCPKTLSGAAIAGIVIGSIVGLVLIVGLTICIYQSCKSGQRKVNPPRQDVRQMTVATQSPKPARRETNPTGPVPPAQGLPPPAYGSQPGYGGQPGYGAQPGYGPQPGAFPQSHLPPLASSGASPPGVYGASAPGPYGAPLGDPYGAPGLDPYSALPPNYPPPAYVSAAEPGYPPSTISPYGGPEAP